MKAWMIQVARLVADLLEYPVGQPEDTVPQIRAVEAAVALAASSDLAAGSCENQALADTGEALAALRAWYERTSLADLQAAHVELFDLRPDCCLYLCWHKYGDSPKQGRAMAGLNELYKDYGFTLTGSNLPDYLPFILEFMLVAPAGGLFVLLDGFAPELRGLAERITASGTGYAHAGRCLAALLRCLAPTVATSGATDASHTACHNGGCS